MATIYYILFVVLFSISLLAQSLPGFSPEDSGRQQELEKLYLAQPRPENCERYLLQITEEPHIAGSPESKRVAEYINNQYNAWGLDSRLVEYYAYLPYPENIRIELIEPVSLGLSLKEPSWKFDKDSYDSRAVMPFNAYSPSGEVTAQVIYVNRGLPDDYEKLKELGVTIQGKVAIVRYGGSFRGVKARVAEEHGVSGLIIYSDPADDGYMRGDIYPNGPMRPQEAIQRGSLLYIFKYPGDPLTPGYAATKNTKRLPVDRAGSITKIPTLPLSYGQARHILQNLAGPEVPDEWQGGLPFRYHIGPGPARVKMHIEVEYQICPIYNVIARIMGIEEPEKTIIIGNHHDAWIYGAVDPGSGTSSVMEVARSFGELLKTGWRPRRTLIIAHWDAEEYGLIGSTEWVEEMESQLRENAVLYINVDSGVSGEDFSARAVPSLDKFIQSLVKQIADPKTGESIFDRWWKKQHEKQARRLQGAVPDTATTGIRRLGSGSDYTAFLQHVGVPSMDIRFRGRYGVYHSILDNFYWMKHWGDPTFHYHATLARVIGLMALRFAQADVFPFDYVAYAQAILDHLQALEKHLKEKFTEVPLDLTPVREEAQAWKDVAQQLNEKVSLALTSGQIPGDLNESLLQIERQFIASPGLPGRDWFKHRIYAPGFYTGYASKPLPGIAELAEKGDWGAAREEIHLLTRLLDGVIQQTQEALQLLQ